MASRLSRLRDSWEDDLQEQVAVLGKEVKALRKSLASQGNAAWESSLDSTAALYEDLRERIAEAMPTIRKQARQVEQTARDNPVATAALVGLVVVGLAVALMSRR